MKQSVENILDTKLLRRDFMTGAAVSGLTFAFTLTGFPTNKLNSALAAGPVRLNAWVTIEPDDTVSVMVPSAEMGQGVMTTLPKIFAEELDADWSKIKHLWAPPTPKL